jgi:hypothetical protein
MTAQDVGAVLGSSEWQGLGFRNGQVRFLCEFPETNTASPLSSEDFANIFNIRADHVSQIRHRAYVKNKSPHTPLKLDPEQETDVVRFIRERFGSQNYVTQRDILNYVEEKFTKTLTPGWMKRLSEIMKWLRPAQQSELPG